MSTFPPGASFSLQLTTGPSSDKTYQSGIMRKTSILVALLALTFASQLGGAQAFISGESVGNWFVNAITNFFWWIINGITGAITALGNTMKDWVTELVGDVFHSLSSATTTFQDNAKKTVTELLNLDEGDHEKLPSSMRFLISIMEAGPLPPEWYFARADPETEVNHLRKWISIIKWGLLIYIAIATILIVVCGIIVARNRALERRIKAAAERKLNHKGATPTEKVSTSPLASLGPPPPPSSHHVNFSMGPGRKMR